MRIIKKFKMSINLKVKLSAYKYYSHKLPFYIII